MDIRNAGGLIARLAVHLDAFNQRHPWNHNEHFHGWILRHLPDRPGRVLDAGCGRGTLIAMLSSRCRQVDGIDADAQMALISGERFAADPTVSVRQLPFEAAEGEYDAITMVASWHHMEEEQALRHARRLLAGGGRLLIVGLARPETLLDMSWDVMSSALNPVVGVLKHPRAARGGRVIMVPVKDPSLTIDQIKAVARRTLPGARVRRRLFYRYTLEWTKPTAKLAGS